LSGEQDLRKEQAPELHDALVPIIARLKKILDRDDAFPFTVSLDDPTGNSWIAPNTSDRGLKYKRQEYPRTHEQNEELGISSDEKAIAAERPEMDAGNPEDLDIVDGQVYVLPAECPGCMKPCEGETIVSFRCVIILTNIISSLVRIKKIFIPHFKDVMIFATHCSHCAFRSSDVKTGGEVPEKGKRITLQVNNIVDLSRDILKSDTCALRCEELDLSVEPGTLGGRFTTVEGILTEVKDQLEGNVMDTVNGGGDSLPADDKVKWERFFDRLDLAIKGELKFVITLEDPMANSYVQDLCSPAVDPQITIEEYTRTAEEEDDLGLTDMKTEGYEQDEEKKE
jgi:zinc finger protein